MSGLHDIYAARGRYLNAHPELAPRSAIIVLGDKAAYFSPIDRTVVDGRTAHREHMAKHGVVEAGDMKLGELASTEKAPMSRAGADIQRTIQELSNR